MLHWLPVGHCDGFPLIMARHPHRRRGAPCDNDMRFALFAFCTLLFISITAAVQLSRPKWLPSSAVLFMGGAPLILIMPSVCALLVYYRRTIPMWRARVMEISISAIAANIAYYVVYAGNWTPNVISDFLCSFFVGAIGVLLVALSPRGSALPVIGCTLQFANLVMWAFPLYGELP